MALRKITCIMPTYNRVGHKSRCVEESVEAFLRQDYPERELIIFNDCANQKISYQHPLVKVINVDDRSTSLSHACNRAAEAGDGELITLWTDDDIRLPWALSTSERQLGNSEYVTIGPHFYSVANKIVHIVRSAVYQTALLTRSLFDDLGGYDPVLNQDHDADIDARAQRTGRAWPPVVLADINAFLIYRWGDGHFHLSGHLPKYRGDPAQYQAQGQRQIDHGHFELQPMWLVDYVAQANEAISCSAHSSLPDRASV